MPLYFGDFLASTAEWSGDEQGLYLLLLGHQWTLGSLPNCPEKLRNLAKMNKVSFGKLWETVAPKFIEKDGRLFNETLESHRSKSLKISEVRSEVGKRGAAARHSKQDGNSHSNCQSFAEANSCHPNQSKPIEEEDGPTAPLFEGEEEPEENHDKQFLFNAFLPVAGGNKNRARLAKLIRDTRGEEETLAHAARAVLEQREKMVARGEEMHDPFSYLASRVAQHNRKRLVV